MTTTFSTRLRVLASVLCLLPCFPSACTAAPDSSWVFVGQAEDGTAASIYVKMDAVEDFGDGNFRVPVLTVYRFEIAGVDVVGPDGEVWTDTDYPHRSVVYRSLYDCARRLSAILESHYFSGEDPLLADLVYMNREAEPLLFPEIFHDPVFDVVCRE